MILCIMFYQICLRTNYLQTKTDIIHTKISNYILDYHLNFCDCDVKSFGF